VHYEFKRSTYIQEQLLVEEVEYIQRFKRQKSWQQITVASSLIRGQFSNSGVSEVVESVII
jgi:hypothetical protein